MKVLMGFLVLLGQTALGTPPPDARMVVTLDHALWTDDQPEARHPLRLTINRAQ